MRSGVLIVAVGVLSGVGAGAVVAGESVGSGRVYTVREGDTVWSIARSTVGESGDPRPLVDGIVRTNDVDPGHLVPGQALELPGV